MSCQLKEDENMTKLQIETNEGIYEGVKDGEYLAFKGIPYAKAPAGEDRFKAPQKAESFQGVRKAEQFGNRSMQLKWNSPGGFFEKEFHSYSDKEIPVSEDGLFLNIWTKENAEKLPVLFYIHGGGFLGGSGSEMQFNTFEYAKRDVILVTMNYRVGIFGFFAHPLLAEENETACGNFGLLDQIAALIWVKENIKNFGGDPDNITICGQSAGGMSVEALMSCRNADGLYQRAIIQSCGGYPQFIMEDKSLDEAFQMGEEVFRHLGIASLSELREIGTDQLLEAQAHIAQSAMKQRKGLPYSPVVNKVLRKKTISDAMRDNEVYLVPTMIGSTKNDIMVTKEETMNQGGRLHQSCIDYSLLMEKLQNNPSYVYYFKRDLPGDDAGAFHSSELWYTFGTLNKCWRPMTEEDYQLSEEMLDYWCQFMKTGNPNKSERSVWELCSEQDKFVMNFG